MVEASSVTSPRRDGWERRVRYLVIISFWSLGRLLPGGALSFLSLFAWLGKVTLLVLKL